MRLTSQQRTWLRWVPATFFGLVLARLVWLAWRAASRGVDFTDEGIYLVSYRYYRNPEMVYNGAPAIFGPLFHLVGYSVVSLRRVKIILLVLCGLGLGWATAGFVRRRTTTTSSVAAITRDVAITGFVAIGGFTMYTWLPQSPGFNDLSVLCAMALAATILPVIDGMSSGRRWLLGAAGAVVAVAFINKWPAGLCMIVVVALALILALGWRDAGRAIGWAGAGFVLACVLLAVVSGPFFERLRELRSTSEQLSDSLPIWNSYLVPYWRDLVAVAGQVGAKVWLILALGVGLAVVVPARRAMVLGAMLAGAVLLALKASWHAGYFRGGDVNAGLSQVALPMLLALAGVVWLIARVAASLPIRAGDDNIGEPVGGAPDFQSSRTGGAALALLIGLAGAQAVGTLNPPLFIAVSSGSLCAAVIVIVAGRSVTIWRPAIVPVAALILVLPLLTERMVLSGLWQRPYRLATNLYAQTENLDGVIGYDGLSTDSGTAQLLHDLSAIAQRRGLAGHPGLSVSNSPGYTLALGLTQPPADLFISSIEYIPDNADIYDARFRTACSRGLISPDNPPVILTAGASAPADISSLLAECGIIFPDDFELELAESPAGAIGVWIPGSLP